jgi:hypothetical protein
MSRPVFRLLYNVGYHCVLHCLWTVSEKELSVPDSDWTICCNMCVLLQYLLIPLPIICIADCCLQAHRLTQGCIFSQFVLQTLHRDV